MPLDRVIAKSALHFWTPARKLMAAALALSGCRVLSGWDSILAGATALVILLALAASLIAGMTRLRRISTFVALPAATAANAVAFALGSFVVLLGAKGLLVYDRIGGGDRQAASLTKFKTLTQLSLNDTKLSDEGLASLGRCKGLRLLEISETRVTAGGVERLRRALPGCNVVWQPP